MVDQSPGVVPQPKIAQAGAQGAKPDREFAKQGESLDEARLNCRGLKREAEGGDPTARENILLFKFFGSEFVGRNGSIDQQPAENLLSKPIADVFLVLVHAVNKKFKPEDLPAKAKINRVRWNEDNFDCHIEIRDLLNYISDRYKVPLTEAHIEQLINPEISLRDFLGVLKDARALYQKNGTALGVKI